MSRIYLLLNRKEMSSEQKSIEEYESVLWWIYPLENEAYRMLPDILKNRYGIELKDKLIRTDVEGKEIDILGSANKDGKEVILVGKVKVRLEDKEAFEELEDKVNAVKKAYKNNDIVRVIVTHYAEKKFIKYAKRKGIIVVQSFEW